MYRRYPEPPSMFTVFVCLLIYVPSENNSLKWRRHHCQERAVTFWPMLGTLILWTGRKKYIYILFQTFCMKRDFGFCVLMQRTASLLTTSKFTEELLLLGSLDRHWASDRRLMGWLVFLCCIVNISVT